MTTIHLQSIGTTPAKPAGELITGDITVWNFGSTEVVLGKAKETKAFVTLLMDCGEYGHHERKLKKTRLVGVK